MGAAEDTTSEVIIFTNPGCPHCSTAKTDLRRRAVRYTGNDVVADPAALRQMLALNSDPRHVLTIVQGV